MDECSRKIDVWGYDFETDTLFFRDKKIKYHSSLDIGDLILDIGDDESPIGVELLNASKNFGANKVILMSIKDLKVDINISKDAIEVKITVYVESRNAKVEKVVVSHGINDVNLRAGQTAMAC